MEFHQNLKSLREKCGMTQEELAEQLGITRQSVSKWELGINEPDLPTIRALCKILGCSYNALLGEEEVGVQENVSIPRAEPKAEKGQYRLYVSQMVCFIVYLVVSLLFSFFPFYILPNGAPFLSFFHAAFGGSDNMNSVSLLVLLSGAATATMMGLLAFLPTRSVSLFKARDALLISDVALMLYCLVFSFQASCFGPGVILLFLTDLVFMGLHFLVPSLRCGGFAGIYGENIVKSADNDRYVFASTLMLVLAMFSLFRINPGDTTFLTALYWTSGLIGFFALVAFAVLFLTLPPRIGRKGIKIGALISLAWVLAFGVIIVDVALLPLILFYWLYIIGVIIAVCLTKTSKSRESC